jgi:hypothetical protein
MYSPAPLPEPRPAPAARIDHDDPELCREVVRVGLTEPDLALLAAFRGPCEAALDALIEAFYAHAGRAAAASAHPPRLRPHVMAMLAGRLDAAYLASRRHADLAPAWPADTYEVIRRLFVTAVIATGAGPAERTAFAQALDRLVQLDLALLRAAHAGAPALPGKAARARRAATCRAAARSCPPRRRRPRPRPVASPAGAEPGRRPM